MATTASSAKAAARELRGRAIVAGTANAHPRVVWSLARVEAREMLHHPAYPIALAAAIMLVGVPRGGRIEVAFVLLGVAVSIVLGTLFSANLGTLRSHRDGTDELFGAAPASVSARTSAHLVAVWIGPAACACAWSVLVLVLQVLDVGDLPDDLRPIMLLQGPLAVAAIGSLGVAVGRWIPHVIGGPLVLALHAFTPLLWGLPWLVFDRELDTNLWHLAYLVAAIVVLSSAALLRDRVRFVPAATFAAGLAVAVLAAFQRVPEGGW